MSRLTLNGLPPDLQPNPSDHKLRSVDIDSQEDARERRRPPAVVARLFLAVSLVLALWGLEVFPRTEPGTVLPFLLSAGAAFGGIYSGRVGWPRRRLPEAALALVLSIGCVGFGIVHSHNCIGGADSYGYVSQADLWRQGNLIVDQPWVSQLPWPDPGPACAPLGYCVAYQSTQNIVPQYAAGLPVLMAMAKFIAGDRALYAVVPCCGGILVGLTYLLGRRLLSSAGGLMAAYLVATSPTFLFMLMAPMSDVPAAAAWTACIYATLGTGLGSACVAGLTSALAILIRPNLVPGAAVMGALLLWRAWRSTDQRAIHFRRGLLFAAGTLLGGITVALINRHLYGSPTSSGYPSVSRLYSLSHLLPNLLRYPRWIFETQTVVGLLGLMSVLWPLPFFWPARERSAQIAMSGFTLCLVSQYLFFLFFDDWWYLRFLLSAWPLIMLGVATLFLRAMSLGARQHTLGCILIVLLGCYQFRLSKSLGVFVVWKGELRYQTVGLRVRQLLPENSVIYSGIHGGSLRYYAGRVTFRYDRTPADWLDQSLQWFASRGVGCYLVLDDWEMPQFRQYFQGQKSLEGLDQGPLLFYQNGMMPVRVYDLLHPQKSSEPAEILTENFEGHDLFPSPAPKPQLRLVSKKASTQFSAGQDPGYQMANVPGNSSTGSGFRSAPGEGVHYDVRDLWDIWLHRNR